MTTTSLTSELEAVNTLLAAIGESSINTLDVSGLADVAAARATLDEISREVQATGWHFNTEDDYPLTRDVDGRIQIAPNIVKVIPASAGGTVTQRGSKLYDKSNHTDIFTEDLKGSVTLILGWSELPQAARHYIMIRAARIFQTRVLGSDTQYRFSDQEEASALKLLVETEGEVGNYNMFSGSYSVTSIMER